MRSLKWLMVIAIGLILLPWQPQLAQSQASTSATNYIVVTLDELGITQISPSVVPVRLKLMLGAISASGSRVQKILWPTAIWAESSPGISHFAEDRSAIPLFALPEDQLGDELGFALIALDNQIPADQHPEDWLNNAMPAVVEAAADPVALWITGQPTSPEDEVNRISQAIAPLLDKNAQLR